MAATVSGSNPSIEQFSEQWLSEIIEGNPSTVELGHRFARKLIVQWLDLDESTGEVIYCDGAGDGGIDAAYLDTGQDEANEEGTQGHTWYLIQSKYGKAFQGTTTCLLYTSSGYVIPKIWQNCHKTE